MSVSSHENGSLVKALGKSSRAVKPSVQRILDERLAGTSQDYVFPKAIRFNGLLTNRLLTGLRGEDLARLLPHLEPVALISGDVYEFGRRLDFIYFPETAVISHVYFLRDGSTTAAAIVGNEGMLGLSAILDSRPVSDWAQVTLGGTASRIKAEVIKEEFARGGPMQQLVLNYMSSHLAQLSQKAVCNGHHRLAERFCTWLLMVRDRTSDDRLRLTHEEIAQHLGARRAGVTSACAALRASGIIKYRRGLITILDRPMLEMAACECYQDLNELVEH